MRFLFALFLWIPVSLLGSMKDTPVCQTQLPYEPYLPAIEKFLKCRNLYGNIHHRDYLRQLRKNEKLLASIVTKLNWAFSMLPEQKSEALKWWLGWGRISMTKGDIGESFNWSRKRGEYVVNQALYDLRNIGTTVKLFDPAIELPECSQMKGVYGQAAARVTDDVETQRLMITHQIYTVGQLIEFSPADLVGLTGFGEGMVRNLGRALFESTGLMLKGEPRPKVLPGIFPEKPL